MTNPPISILEAILFIGFSCRSSTYPRLLYGIQRLFLDRSLGWWQIYLIRNRPFGRKSVQSVMDSSINAHHNQTDFEPVPSEMFLIPGDYLIVECERRFGNNCQFLIYYSYRNIPYPSTNTDSRCRTNDYPSLFKFASSIG